MHILKSCTKQMEMTNSHQTYFWNLKLQRVFSVFCNLTIRCSCHRLCFFTEKKNVLDLFRFQLQGNLRWIHFFSARRKRSTEFKKRKPIFGFKLKSSFFVIESCKHLRQKCHFKFLSFYSSEIGSEFMWYLLS